jgi:putative CocE/NonD family hydrolase
MNPHIPLKGSTAGRQYADWEPRAVAMHGLGNRVLADQRIPVSEGAELHADVYIPRTPGRYPAVVSFGGYATEGSTAGIPAGSNEIGSPPVFTDRGYCPVIVERRGMGRSTGEQVMFFDPRDIDDHETVISWAAEQPWCNGEVVLFGTSYYAVAQLSVAARKPPALKALFLNEVSTDLWRHMVHFGGVPAWFFVSLWMGANYTEKNYSQRISPDRRALISHLTNGPLHPLLEKLVHRKVSGMFESFQSATPVEFMRRIYASWMFDEKTRAQASIPEGPTATLADIDVPFTVVQNLGYFNLHQFGCYDLVERAGTPAADKWLILAPPAYDLPVYAWQGEALAFFDHILRRTDNGYAEQPHVRYWVDGTDGFDTADTFPPPGSSVRRLHLGAGTASTHQLSADPAPDGSGSWVAIPLGLPELGGLDEVANQVLTFELPISEDIQLAGPVTARLLFSCNEIDSYVLARLSRVDTDGQRHQLSLGGIRPAARTEDTERSTALEIAIDAGHREPLVPDEPVVLRFSLTPGPVQLRAGDTLRLDLASRTDLLRMDPSEGYAQFELPTPPYPCRNTVHFGGQSWIEVTQVSLPGA